MSSPSAPLERVPLAERTTLGLGGDARYLVEAHDERDIASALAWADARSLPVRVIGGGSNLVVADEGVDALVIAVATRGVDITLSGDIAHVRAAAGEPWDALVERTVGEDLAGLECLSGIPGLVGATPIQNVGAYGQEVADTIEAVRVIDRVERRERQLSPSECGFAYRDSRLKREPDRFVVLDVTFGLRRGGAPLLRYAELARALAAGTPDLRTTRETVIALRRSKSMVLDALDENRRSAGSFFTNPVVTEDLAARVLAAAAQAGLGDVPRWPAGTDGEGRALTKLAAGWLIEKSGITRGLRRGSVGVSSKHALALVHHGGGTTRELLALADEIRARVHERFGVELSREPVLWG